MKKFIFTVTAVLVIAGFLTTGYAQISGTSHDFSGSAWNSSGEICIVCHTPHNADLTVSDAPLWNHEVTTTTFTLYSSSTLDATAGQPSGISKLCLSCHDGTVALENFGGTTTGSNMIAAAGDLGTDISDDHPISITYDAALATSDGELYDPTSTTSGLGGNIDADMLFGSSNNQLECASCHDVHSSATSMLLKANTGSALCLTCHDK